MPLHASELNRRTFRELSELLRSGGSTLALVGAGTSARMGYPTWGRLLDEMDALVEQHNPQPPKLRANRQKQQDWLWRAEEYRRLLSPEDYHSFLEHAFDDESGKPLDPCLRTLVELPFRHVLTTNYDGLLERAHHEVTDRPAAVIEWNDSRKLRELFVRLGDPSYTRRYVHLHGLASRPETVVLTDSDYLERYSRSLDAHRRLFALFATQQVVFIGFSLNDPELGALLREVQASMGPGPAPHFALLALREDESDVLERRRLKEKYGVEALFYPYTPDHSRLGDVLQALKEGRGDYGNMWEDWAFEPTRLSDSRGPSSSRDTLESFALAFAEPGSTPATPSPEPSRAVDPEDPQKGRWGGRPERSHRHLSARVAALDDGWFLVQLQVASTDPAKHPLSGKVRFHLHDTFPQPTLELPVAKGVATLELRVYGAFTVGAEADEEATRLELDLATLENAPREFRER
jgi:hypothetical protein